MTINSTQPQKLDPKLTLIMDLIDTTYYLDLSRKNNETISIPKTLIKEEWNILAERFDNNTGYYGAAFKHCRDNKIIIVHNGTQPEDIPTIIKSFLKSLTEKISFSNILKSISPDYLDDFRIVFDKIPHQAEIALKFVRDIKSENRDAEIIMGGHSLGGSLTEYCYMVDQTIESFAFDSPGIVVSQKDVSTKSYNSNIQNINYYFPVCPTIPSSVMKHLFNDSEFEENSKVYRLFYPLQNPLNKIDFLEYNKVSWDLHTGMLPQQENFTIKQYPDPKEWPIGLIDGLEFFFSRDNEEGWKIFLDDYWKEVCSQGDIENNTDNFDYFFDYFAKNYLDSAKGTWKDVVHIQNLNELVEYQETPIYSKLGYLAYDSLTSLYRSFQNYKSINEDLVSEYLNYLSQKDLEPEDKTYMELGFEFLGKCKDLLSDYNPIPSLTDFVKQEFNGFAIYLSSTFSDLKANLTSYFYSEDSYEDNQDIIGLNNDQENV